MVFKPQAKHDNIQKYENQKTEPLENQPNPFK